MTIPISPLATVPQGLVDTADAYVAQRLAEDVPSGNFRRGVLHDIVQRLHSVLEAALQQIVATYQASNSLQAIASNPDLADPALVDAVLSNFRVTRPAGSPAQGSVTITLDGPYPVTIQAGTVFTTGSASFTADDAFAARASADAVLGATDILLTPVPGSSGQYAFTITVTATQDGPASALRRGTALTLDAPPPHFVAAAAAADFTGGSLAATNADLLALLAAGMALQAPSNRDTVKALILNQSAFNGFLSFSEAGFGDPEQIRYHSVLPIAFGGRRDLYVRTAALPVTVTLSKTATATADGLWQVSVTAADAPGFYDAVGAISAAGTAYNLTTVTRSIDLTVLPPAPDVVGAVEGCYTAYQTAVVLLTDPGGLATPGATQTVSLLVRCLPSLADVQAFLNDRGRRPDASDLLVRAPVPCFVGVNLTVFVGRGSAAPDTSALAATLAAAVNNTGFAGRLQAADLAAAVLTALGSGYSLGGFDLAGRYLFPDGYILFQRSGDALTVPYLPRRLVSRRTVNYYLDPVDVGITVVAAAID